MEHDRNCFVWDACISSPYRLTNHSTFNRYIDIRVLILVNDAHELLRSSECILSIHQSLTMVITYVQRIIFIKNYLLLKLQYLQRHYGSKLKSVTMLQLYKLLDGIIFIQKLAGRENNYCKSYEITLLMIKNVSDVFIHLL